MEHTHTQPIKIINVVKDWHIQRKGLDAIPALIINASSNGFKTIRFDMPRGFSEAERVITLIRHMGSMTKNIETVLYIDNEEVCF